MLEFFIRHACYCVTELIDHRSLPRFLGKCCAVPHISFDRSHPHFSHPQASSSRNNIRQRNVASRRVACHPQTLSR